MSMFCLLGIFRHTESARKGMLPVYVHVCTCMHAREKSGCVHEPIRYQAVWETRTTKL